MNRQTQGWDGVRLLGPRTLLGAGVVLGALSGAGGFVFLEHPAWLGLWVVLFLGLGWAGWDVRLRQVGALPETRRGVAQRPRPVKDGPFDMIELAGGRFLMGSAEEEPLASANEKPQHAVTLSGFRIGRTQVTRGQWRAVMALNKSFDDKDELPADVSWVDAVGFCNALSQREGYRPCYRQVGWWRFRRWIFEGSSDGYRLPSEAEWEYACRAGTDSPWSHGDNPLVLGDYAWYADNSGGELHPVAQKRPNPWGLYDMHGNVWEWCWDWYGRYTDASALDPSGPDSGPGRVLRGGAFGASPEGLRSANRVGDGPVFGYRHVGFRCVRVPARQH